MSERTAIVIDGTSAVSDEIQRDFSFRLMPLHVIFGDEEFTPGVDLTPAQFYTKLASSRVPPTTSAPSLGECLDVFQGLAREGYKSILAITVINEASVTHQVAKTAAEQVHDFIRIRGVVRHLEPWVLQLLGLVTSMLQAAGGGVEEVMNLRKLGLRQRNAVGGLRFSLRRSTSQERSEVADGFIECERLDRN